MSLAEELLADLEDYDADDDVDQGNEADQNNERIDEIEEITEMEIDGSNYDRVTKVARLRDSENFKRILEKVNEGISTDYDEAIIGPLHAGPVETDPEYQLIVEANNLAVEVDNDINVIHKFVRDKYGKRFPELESLVPMPLEYISCVKELGNDILEKAKNSEALQKILMPATVIVVSVTASTTQGERLTDDELQIVDEACDMAFELNEAKMKIYQFVEMRMAYVAPNLSAIVGSATAAKLMGVAGGLSQLCKMPACNILVLGAQKNTLSGFSSTAILPHTGFVYYSSLVQSLPVDLRKKGARLVAAKCTLAARVDSVHASNDGAIGQKFADEISSKLDKWIEPPPVKNVKALPKPLDQASKKRGGRRVRKMKERLGMTEMRRKANRMNFGDIQEDVMQNNMGFTLGQMKSGAPGGRIRAAQVDQKSRVRMSKALQKNLHKQNVTIGGGSTTVKKQVSGTVSTVTFTPVQGLEIVNPQTQEKKINEANAKYFGTTTGFMKLSQTPIPQVGKGVKFI